MSAKKRPLRSGTGTKSAVPPPTDITSDKVTTLDGFLRQFVAQHKGRPDQPFCFILGAGASRDSGIKTGGEMAEDWLRQLHENRNLSSLALDKWIADGHLGIADFERKTAARHYSQLYEILYKDKEQAGYCYLEEVMEGKDPSFGYSVLSYLLSETHHRIVITTNFDNLVTDALAIHSGTFPIVVNDDSLVQYVRANVHRPLVVKIHGSLGFKPKSREDDLTFDEKWRKALAAIFQTHTPIVIGYDGNDGSLMRLLEETSAGAPPEFLWWCYLCKNGDDPLRRASEQPERVRKLIMSRPAEMVPIPGFDLLMLKLLTLLKKEMPDTPDLVENLEQRTAKRLEDYKSQRTKLGEELATAANDRSAAGSTTKTAEPKPDLSAELALLAKGSTTKTWWQWQNEINALAKADEHEAHYREAIQALPTSAELLGNYAVFLKNIRKDHDAAEAVYKRAIEADPNHANNLGNYANFLKNIRKDHDAAEAVYKRAIEADPNHANILGNYAAFLNDIRKDHDAAEAVYKRAIDADPNHSNILGNFGQFLLGRGRTEEGLAHLRVAWQNDDRAKPSNTAELAYSLWLGSVLAGKEEPVWERAFRLLVGTGFPRHPWNFDAMLAQAEDKLPPDEFAYAKALASAFLDESEVADLEKIPRWQAVKPVDPELVNSDGTIRQN